MYKSFLYLTGEIKQQSSVWKTQVSTGQLQIRWDEILIWMICIGVSRFPVRYRLYLLMVNELSLVADILLRNWHWLYLNSFTQKEVKMKLFRYRVKAGMSYLFFFLFVFVFFLQCSGTRDKTFFFLHLFCENWNIIKFDI